ncbi:MAG: HEAT repeat domain-containing protein [Planctomycetota bacterium]|jgi:aminopeptidase N
MKTVKEVTGQNMDWFFEQYFFAPGHPVFEIASTWDADAGQVRLHVAQVQDRDHGIPIYRTPVRIGIVTASGKTVETVWLENDQDVFVFESREEPLLVRFDEGNWLLKEWTYNKDVEELLYQARRDDVIGREWAVRQLERSGDEERVREALVNIATEDPFWAVRLAAIETMANVDIAAAIGPAGIAAIDTSSRVRRAAIRILGERDDPAMVPFFRSRFEADDSYLVQAEALRAIGRSGDPSQLEFLRQASEMPSYRDVIRRAALWAIEELAEGR